MCSGCTFQRVIIKVAEDGKHEFLKYQLKDLLKGVKNVYKVYLISEQLHLQLRCFNRPHQESTAVAVG